MTELTVKLAGCLREIIALINGRRENSKCWPTIDQLFFTFIDQLLTTWLTDHPDSKNLNN